MKAHKFLKRYKKLNRKYKHIFLLSITLINLIIPNKNNNVKICLCAIVKNENKYLREFIKHYKKIGYDKIFLYDNNDLKGEKIEEVINDFIRKGFVKVFDFREKKLNPNQQLAAYRDCYSRNSKFYNWLSFYDIDEYVEINKKYKKMKDFLNDKIFINCQSIKINLVYYYDYNLLYYENKPLQERIKKFSLDNPANKHIKSTVRGNLSINFWQKAKDPHTSQIKFTSCSSSGKRVRYNSPFVNPPDYVNAKIKHYYYKSFEEYCLKIKRGRADMKYNQSNKKIKEIKSKLFLLNKNFPEKMKIFKKIFNIL